MSPPHYPLHISARQPTGKSSQIAPLVRNRGVHTSLGQSRDPRGARERVRKAIDNSSSSSKVTEQGSARGYSTIKHGQINFKPVSSPFHQPSPSIILVLQPIPQPPKTQNSSVLLIINKTLHHRGLFVMFNTSEREVIITHTRA